MKLKITVNIGNYSNIGIESSEYDTIDECKSEVKKGFLIFGEPATNDFVKIWLKDD